MNITSTDKISVKLRLFILFAMITFNLNADDGLKQMQIQGQPEIIQAEIISRRDSSGRLCAGIQIATDITGLAYDSYNGIVGDTEHKPGQDMVFVSPDERVLQVYAPGYEEFKIILSEYRISLSPKAVWRITITGEQTRESWPVVVITQPEGGTISIDGLEMGTGRQHILSEGEHNIRISKDNYQPIIDKIFVSADQVLFEYFLEEIEDVKLNIFTNPDSARVYVDGVSLGISPIRGFYPAGRYSLRIEKDWQVTLEDYIDIQAPGFDQLYTLQPDYGSLNVISAPETGLQISLNGIHQKGALTPYLFNRVKTGTYLISASSEHYLTGSESVEIERGEEYVVNLIAEAKFATLTVQSTPEKDLDILLDGVLQEGVQTPHTFDYLQPGSYRVQARSNLFITEEKQLTLNAGGVTQVTLDSQSNYAVLTIVTSENAQVFINGQKYDYLDKILLEPMVANIEVRENKAETLVRQVTLKNGDEITLEMIPDVLSGTIQVIVESDDAVIVLTGDAGERFTGIGMSNFKDIPIGDYTIEINVDEYVPLTRRITISEGQKAVERFIFTDEQNRQWLAARQAEIEKDERREKQLLENERLEKEIKEKLKSKFTKFTGFVGYYQLSADNSALKYRTDKSSVFLNAGFDFGNLKIQYSAAQSIPWKTDIPEYLVGTDYWMTTEGYEFCYGFSIPISLGRIKDNEYKSGITAFPYAGIIFSKIKLEYQDGIVAEFGNNNRVLGAELRFYFLNLRLSGGYKKQIGSKYTGWEGIYAEIGYWP